MHMENDSKLKKLVDELSDKIQEQQWFQQLRAKWDELDPLTKLYSKLGAAAGTVLLVLVFVLVSILQVRSLKKELSSKIELKMVIQNAAEEIRNLRVKGGGGYSGDHFGGWQQAVKAAANNAGIDEAALDLGAEKPVD